MYKTFAIALFILAFALAGSAQETCSRYSAAGFSMCPPPAWRIEERANEPYKMFFGPASNVFVANLNFKDSPSTSALKDYVDAAVDTLLKNYKDIGLTSIKLVSRTDFVTGQKEKGVKLVYLSEFKGLQINTVQYIFDTGGKKLIITGTGIEAESAGNDTIFDAAVKTLNIDR